MKIESKTKHTADAIDAESNKHFFKIRPHDNKENEKKKESNKSFTVSLAAVSISLYFPRKEIFNKTKNQ